MTDPKSKILAKVFPLRGVGSRVFGSICVRAFLLFVKLLNRLEFDREADMSALDGSIAVHAHNSLSKKYKDQYSGKTVVVTGGGSGIGAELSRAFSAYGATVVIADRDLAKASDLAREIGPLACAEVVDVADPASVQSLFDRCRSHVKTIDLVVNSAGVLMQGAAESISDKDWARVIGVNLLGTIYVSMAAYREMTKQGHGQIVNIASGSALNAPPFQLPYASSKYGAFGFTLGLRAEGARRNIHVSVVCPGNIATPMVSLASSKPSDITPTMSVQSAVAKILKGIGDNRGIIVFPRYQRAFWYLERFSPRLGARLRRSL